MKQATSIRDIDWVADVPAQCMQNAIERLDKAYQRFFKTCKNGGGFPKFASKKDYRSIIINNVNKTVRITGNRVRVPKLGELKIFKDSPVIGNIKYLTIKSEVSGFYVTITCDEVPKKFASENQAIGLDMGVSNFCIDSNGGFIANPKHFKKYERKLRIEGRSLSRKKKGSNGWKRQCKKLSLLHHKISNVRRDFLHKESTAIAKKYSEVYMEGLTIKNMVKNKSINKYILDCGWGIFKEMVSYKTDVTVVNPKYTSQTCFECGEQDAKSRVSQSEFVCTSCGHISNADINAAKNILSRGTALSR